MNIDKLNELEKHVKGHIKYVPLDVPDASDLIALAKKGLEFEQFKKRITVKVQLEMSEDNYKLEELVKELAEALEKIEAYEEGSWDDPYVSNIAKQALAKVKEKGML